MTPLMQGNEDDGAAIRPLLVSVKQAAALLGVSRTMIYELTYRGEIHPLRIGRCVRFRRQELEDFVAQLEARG
jgi:excisionase family DNA binding protein